MPAVYVGVGSNVERERNIARATALLRERFAPLHLSPVYRSNPVDCAGDDFYNLVIGLHSDEPPERVASALRAIEAACGRVRSPAPGTAARTLDLDLLLYGDYVARGAGYRVPREDVLAYAFVLCPLADLAPALRHPVDGRTMAELWAAFDTPGQRLERVDFPPAETTP